MLVTPYSTSELVSLKHTPPMSDSRLWHTITSVGRAGVSRGSPAFTTAKAKLHSPGLCVLCDIRLAEGKGMRAGVAEMWKNEVGRESLAAREYWKAYRLEG